MTPTSLSSRATWRTARRSVVAAVVLVLASATAAAAVGVAGVDLSVGLPEDRDGRPQLDVAAETEAVEIRLRNLEDEPRTVSLYAVSATPNDEDSFALGGPSSADWFGVGEHTVTLDPREERTFVAEPRSRSMPQDATHLAVVLEAGTDSTLVTRAARVVELRGDGPTGLPWWLIALATALLVSTLGAHAWRWHRERRGGAPSAADADAPVVDSAPPVRVPEHV